MEAQDGVPMHSNGMLSGWKFSNFKSGVFAEYFHVNDADMNLALLPKGMPLEQVVMLSDMETTGIQGAEIAKNMVLFKRFPGNSKKFVCNTQESTKRKDYVCYSAFCEVNH